jgi:nitrate reductase beta subunit
MLPVMASLAKGKNAEQASELGDVVKRWDDDWLYDTSTEELWGTIDQARFPLEYMASLFSAGDTEMVKKRLVKLMAVRVYRRWKTVGDISEERARQTLNEAGLTAEMAEDIYYLTSLPKFDDRFVIPASHREQAMEMMEFTGDKKGSTGFGFKEGTDQRGP